MKTSLKDYLYNSRWCNFKEEIRCNRVSHIELSKLPFDDGKKLFVLGTVEMDKSSEEKPDIRYFSIPLSVKENFSADDKILALDGKNYSDALLEPDFWPAFMRFLDENDGKIIFPNGWTMEARLDDRVREYAQSSSKPLGVEQSNTTLAVGDKKLAFKLERMLDFSSYQNPEFEMNDKLMREKATLMPETYGFFILKNEKGEVSSSGILQEFVKNKGDMWGYSLDYLKAKLRENFARQKTLTPEDNAPFMDMMHILSRKTQEMNECFGRDDDNPSFSPEKVDEKIIEEYSRHFDVTLYQTKEAIRNNVDSLPEDTKKQAKYLLENWDELMGNFKNSKFAQIRALEDKGTINRVHGDFHLGQVMVTLDDDLKFVDFAGEPSLPLVERRKKYISVRDMAGMYRSIKGYLGAVAVEEFSAEAQSEDMVAFRKQWAEKAIKPLIDEASRVFLGDKSLNEPWLSLEVMRKNLYEVNYEVNNRPGMAYVPIKGLTELLKTTGNERIRSANENISDKAV